MSAAYGLDATLLEEYHNQIWRDADAVEHVIAALRKTLFSLRLDGGEESTYVLKLFAQVCGVHIDIVKGCRMQLTLELWKGSDSVVTADSKRLLCDFLRAMPLESEEKIASGFAKAICVDVTVVRKCWKRLHSNEESTGSRSQIVPLTLPSNADVDKEPIHSPKVTAPDKFQESIQLSSDHQCEGATDLEAAIEDEKTKQKSKTVQGLDTFLHAIVIHEPWLDEVISKMEHSSRDPFLSAPNL
ncbi:hypothetical protein SCHPADRAFT_602179 [Schizopora paradoxa]|uniref:Uncharacterized protein n=1 Tax=Schizopora paradoxa TaxID=27342 RepID=A0A0H2R9W3_9AGAM|nr:hypothetical protein SCHPADRAFT_602179 [Schizopora paradoxa]